MDYRVISSFSALDARHIAVRNLEKDVSTALNEGYELQGSVQVVITSDYYSIYQAVVKK